MPIQTVAIVGAGGSSGACALQHAVGRIPNVVGIDKVLPDPADRIAGVEYRQGDLLEGDIGAMLDGCDAVISALGLPFTPQNAIDPPPLYTKGTERLLAAMRRAGIGRLAVISAAFVRSQPSLPTWFSLTVVPALHAILEQMRAMETMLEAEPDLAWTIVRPGWLLDKPAGDGLLVGEGTLPPGAFRCREGDLGRFLVDCIVDGIHIRQKPAIGAPEDQADEGPQALGAELGKIVASLKS